MNVCSEYSMRFHASIQSICFTRNILQGMCELSVVQKDIAFLVKTTSCLHRWTLSFKDNTEHSCATNRSPFPTLFAFTHFPAILLS